MDLNTFKKQYSNRPAALAMFMHTSALSWLEYAQKISGGSFKPDINRIMKFSDADEDYYFDYGKDHTSINPNVTVGELLRVANNLLSYDYEVSDSWDDEYDDDYDDELDDDYDSEDDSEDVSEDVSEDEPKPDPQKDGMYIVNCLMVYPFTMKEDIV